MAKGRNGYRRFPTVRIDSQLLLFGAVLGLLILFVAVPMTLTLFNSFRGSWAGQHSGFTLEGWRVALAEPGMRSSILTTLALLLARTLISFPIAIVIAWLLARTDLPGREWLEFLFWILFFMPSLAATLGWILLLDSDSGLLNQFLARLLGAQKGPFNIYSFWGIVWVHVASTALSFKVILLAPLFRNMDASLEEASRVCGATALQTFRRILVPVMSPATALVLTAALVYGLQTFEIELILGIPAGIYVYSTKIYSLLRQEPPLFGAASALSSIVLLIVVPLVASQRGLLLRRQYTTLTGRYSGRRVSLGRWKIPAVMFVLSTALLLTIVPMSMLLVGSFMKLLGYFQIEDPWTVAHWKIVLTDALFVRSAFNTLRVGVATALLTVISCCVLAYLSLRAPYRLRLALDILSWLPSGLPGILLGVALLTVVVAVPFLLPLYGTVALLILAAVVVNLPTGTQLIKSNLLQISTELEEASRIAGASLGATFRRILVPILSPVLLMVGVISFTRAAQEIGSIALLATADSRPLALLQLDYMTGGQYESATVIATLISAMSIAGAFAARLALKRLDRTVESQISDPGRNSGIANRGSG